MKVVRMPTLFNFYANELLKEIKKENFGKIKICEMSVHMLRFANDIAMIAENENDLNIMLNKILHTN